MPNSKHVDVKAKHRKRKERLKQKRVQEIGNAKKKTMRDMRLTDSLPHIYKDRI